MADTLNQATRLATEAGRGDAEAAARLLPLVYDELRELAATLLGHERSGHTLQPTALVHEAYMKLVDGTRIDILGRTHFRALAARAMRRILIDHARGHTAEKRGGGRLTVSLDECARLFQGRRVDFSHVTVALDRLAKLDERKSQVVELRFFGGLTIDEVAQYLGVSVSTVESDWRVARAWLGRELSGMEDP